MRAIVSLKSRSLRVSSAAEALHSKRLLQLALRILSVAGILSRKASDRGPIEGFPTLSEEPQKAIM